MESSLYIIAGPLNYTVPAGSCLAHRTTTPRASPSPPPALAGLGRLLEHGLSLDRPPPKHELECPSAGAGAGDNVFQKDSENEQLAVGNS